MKKESLRILLALLMSMVASVASAQKIEIDGIYYYFTKDEAEVTYDDDNKYSGAVNIPASVEYDGRPYIVNRIRESAFNECTGLTSVTIPSSVTSIGSEAFKECSQLTSVTFAENSELNSIGDYAFQWCGSLASITIPSSVKSIGSEAFAYCTGLSSITIPSSVESIGEDAFEGCYFLDSNFTNSGQHDGSPWGATLCDEETQDGLLIKVNTVEICRPWATSVNIPNSVIEIGESAFEDCTGLSSITIPSSVESIGDYAFWNCSSLTSITCYATTPPTLGDDSFYNISSDATLYVPIGTKNDYEESAWASYFGYGERIVEIVEVKISDAGMATFSSDKALDFSNVEGGLKAYIIPEGPTDDELNLQPVGAVPAKTGLLLKGNEGTYSVPFATTASPVEDNLLVAGSELVSPTDGDYTNYILANGGSGIGFYKFRNERDLSGKAYLQLPASDNGVNGFKFVFSDEEVNAIADVPSYGTGTGEALYNLAGQRVQKPAKGIYIMGGKKVFMK